MVRPIRLATGNAGSAGSLNEWDQRIKWIDERQNEHFEGRGNMTTKVTQIVDATARVVLPKGFAKATVTLEEVSETEVRICKTRGNAQEREFAEETITPLSDRDRDLFLQLIEAPPSPNVALQNAIHEHRKQYG
jgi:hypothetical protein